MNLADLPLFAAAARAPAPHPQDVARCRAYLVEFRDRSWWVPRPIAEAATVSRFADRLTPADVSRVADEVWSAACRVRAA